MSFSASQSDSDLHEVQLPNSDLSVAFAQKYLQQLKGNDTQGSVVQDHFLERRRAGIADNLLSSLRTISAKSWMQTENLLASEVQRHSIDFNSIDPWQISSGIHQVYQEAIQVYAQQESPYRLVKQVGSILGETRQQATAIDPRAIGFVAMQYHYTGMQLMKLLPDGEQANFAAYVKVLDDHLYMPLQRAYQAAAQHAPDSIALQSVRLLMLRVDEIAERIVERVIQLYPRYRCHTGFLSQSEVRTSSVRDVEMFQVYMWVCLLEGNLQALETELFPLCVMIYPRLKVSWELVSQMTHLLRKEVNACLSATEAEYCAPYYDVLKRLFSPEMFPNC